MTASDISFADALAFVAARAVAARTAKDAGVLDFLGITDPRSPRGLAAADATRARKDLGLLGADPARIDQTVAGLRAGQLSPARAVSRIRHSTPSVYTQAVQTPQAVAQALHEGDTRGALNQADVLGLKNLADPAMAGLALGGAASGVAGIKALQDRWRDTDLLTGRTEAARKTLGETVEPRVAGLAEGFRSTPAATTLENQANQFKGLGAAGTLFGAGKQRFEAAKTQALGAAPAGTLERARGRYAGMGPGAKGGKPPAPRMSAGGKALAVGGLATLPLMLKEWFGGGHRSGKEPARKLVGATQTLAGG